MTAQKTEGLSADYAPVGMDLIGTSGVYHNTEPNVVITLTARLENGSQRQSFVLIEPGEALSFAILLTKLAYRAMRDARRMKRDKSNGQPS